MQPKHIENSSLFCSVDEGTALAHQMISSVRTRMPRSSEQREQALLRPPTDTTTQEKLEECLEYTLHVRRKTFNSIPR